MVQLQKTKELTSLTYYLKINPRRLNREERKMDKNLDRRNFLKKSITASAAAAAGFGLEKKLLSAEHQNKSSTAQPKDQNPETMPTGKIKHLKISRLISGGNLISGYTHRRERRKHHNSRPTR